jgi:hypothetical protein
MGVHNIHDEWEQMTTQQNSIDTDQASRDSTSHTNEENSTLPSDDQLQELASGHLEEALQTDSLSEKNYHIQSALQALVIAEENHRA